MEECFEQGMDPFVVNNKGDTVLDVLLSGEKFVCGKSFITAVVAKDSNNAVRQNANGDTFLHVLCKCCDDRVQELIELVLNLGVKLREGHTIACSVQETGCSVLRVI